jgi:hypothetical protein
MPKIMTDCHSFLEFCRKMPNLASFNLCFLNSKIQQGKSKGYGSLIIFSNIE